MALQIRRGLEADRLSITPLAGELLYVTDTGNVYVGDGTTAGGALVTGDVVDDTSPALGGDLNLNGNDIIGTGNINITGTITATGNINLGDASADDISVLGSLTTSITPKIDSAVDVGSPALRWRNGYFAGLTVNGQIDATAINSRIIADDSTIAYDPSNGVFDGTTFLGNLTGNASGNHTGTFTGSVTGTLDGDMNGSVFGDDSTLLIDGVNNTHIIDSALSTQFTEWGTTQVGDRTVRLSANASRSILQLFYKDTSQDLSLSNLSYGTLSFGREDSVDARPTVLMTGRVNGLFISAGDDASGIFPESNYMVLTRDGNFGIGTYAPQKPLDIRGDGIFTGDVTAAAFKGTIAADDSSIIIDGTTGGLIVANIDVIGETGNTPVDTGSVDSWLEVTVNGATKYIPLYD
jgi:hypothetical protein